MSGDAARDPPETMLDVSTWQPTAEEPRGIRSKRWVVDDAGAVWLRKERRASRPHEPAIESRALRLARECGLEAAEARACCWMEDDPSLPRFGVVVRSFLSSRIETLTHGAEEMKGRDPLYNPDDHSTQTVERVRDTLQQLEQGAAGVALLLPFARMLLFDAWIGNSDRHPANWGVIRPTKGGMRLAPMYDPAACLGAELQPGHPLLDPATAVARVAPYVEKCPSGFGDGKRLMGQVGVMRALREWPEVKGNGGALLARCREAMDTFFEQPPDEDGFPAERATLARSLLLHRLAWLEARL